MADHLDIEFMITTEESERQLEEVVYGRSPTRLPSSSPERLELSNMALQISDSLAILRRHILGQHKLPRGVRENLIVSAQKVLELLDRIEDEP